MTDQWLPKKASPDPPLGRYIRSLTQALNRAIAISLKRDPLEARYVRAVILVKGVHFYGFHCSYSPFLKVIMADPGLVQRAATVLRSGVVLRQKIQTFETHISYIMQFMCDFGLYGCGWLEFSRYYLREGSMEAGIRDTLPGQFSQSPHPKASRMSIEIDIISHQILNRYKLSQRHLHHKLNTSSSAPSSEPLVQSVRELWDSERVRRLANGLNPTPELPREGSASQRGAGGQWEQEPLFWEQLRARMNNPKAEVNIPQGWEKWVMTAFEGVEALWEEGWKTWMPQLSGRMPEVEETTKPATQVARELNPFGLTQVEQNPGPQTTHVPNQDDVDEDIAAGQALQRLVIAAEEGDDWHDTDEQWDDDLPIEDELEEMMATQVASREVSVPATPTKQRFRTTTPVPSFRENGQFNTPDRTKSKSRPYASPTTTPSKKLTIKDSPSKFDRILEDLEKAPIPIPTLAGGTTVVNLTPGTHLVRTRADARIPMIEEGNPFLDADVTYPGPAKIPRVQDDTSPVTKRKKLTHELGQESTRKTTRWADLEEQLINITYRPQTPVVPASVYEYNRRPPSAKELVESLIDYGLPSKIYRVPYYSNEEDVPEQPMRYAGRVYHIKGGTGVGSLEHWESNEQPAQALQNVPEITGWEYAGVPPSSRVVKQWLDSVPSQDLKRVPNIGRSQIEGPTQNTHGFEITQKKSGSGARQKQTISAMSVEIFVRTRGDLLPNPAEDAITCLFYSHSESGGDAEDRADYHSGCLVVCPDQPPLVDPRWVPGYKIEIVSSELDLLNALIDLVREFDPDILAGWQVQTASWGYIDARCHSTGLVLSEEIARVSSNHGHKPGSEQWDDRHGASFRVVGRHVLNVWRIMRSEQSLDQYTYENVVFHLMHKRVPKYSPKTLTQWFNSDFPSRVVRVLKYWRDRTATILDLLDHTELILRTAIRIYCAHKTVGLSALLGESARIIGVDFMSVLTRGSQFKVESIMFKIAKQENYVLISPSKEQVGSQNACESLPLVMEPESAFYSPLVVLDFQSLYPSIMIAYNYCYSTFLGRCALFQGKNKFGVTELDMPPGLLETIGEENIHIAANGMAYAKRNVREGLLGRMLMELLNTRIMVKQAMKSAKGDRGLHKILNARQLSLKLMCNVTFGYTMAGFSGRMPAAEIADSIVQSGRETLEKAIALIEATPKWGARVVYGDTDSLFIYLPGRTKDEAFRIGNEIANVVTESNPPPIKLKFEKASVYYPCVLMTKKRYVGFKYENPDDKQPEFDAKGIETVRRDGIPAGQKMVERCLKILFRTQDFSEVKKYCVDSWTKILKGQASPQDFIFAKEVRLGTYSDKVAPPPGATVAARKLALDPMSEPQYGERIPYVIIRGEPGSRLVDRAVPPEELLRDRHKSIDENYYITHSLIPPLERIFNLVGANVRQWFEEMPKPSRLDPVAATSDPQESEINNRLNIDDHFRRLECLVCKQPSDTNVCDDCLDDPLLSGKTLLEKVRRVERRVKGAQLVCAMCTESPASETIMCESLDCPWMYARVKNAQKLENIKQIQALITQFPSLRIQAGEDSHSSDI